MIDILYTVRLCLILYLLLVIHKLRDWIIILKKNVSFGRGFAVASEQNALAVRDDCLY